MTRRTLLPSLVLFLCIILLCGCASSSEPGNTQVQPSVAAQAGSDKELIEALLQDEDLAFWFEASAPAPYTQERFLALCERCPNLAALMERDTGSESLMQYGPELIRQYHDTDQPRSRLNALILADVIGYQCPEAAADMEELTEELSTE